MKQSLSLLFAAYFVAAASLIAQAQDVKLRQQALQALRQATDFYCTQVSTEGGYLWRYTPDLTRREGEQPATTLSTTIPSAT